MLKARTTYRPRKPALAGSLFKRRAFRQRPTFSQEAYTFRFGNPLKYTDPSGETHTWPDKTEQTIAYKQYLMDSYDANMAAMGPSENMYSTDMFWLAQQIAYDNPNMDLATIYNDLRAGGTGYYAQSDDNNSPEPDGGTKGGAVGTTYIVSPSGKIKETKPSEDGKDHVIMTNIWGTELRSESFDAGSLTITTEKIQADGMWGSFGGKSTVTMIAAPNMSDTEAQRLFELLASSGTSEWHWTAGGTVENPGHALVSSHDKCKVDGEVFANEVGNAIRNNLRADIHNHPFSDPTPSGRSGPISTGDYGALQWRISKFGSAPSYIYIPGYDNSPHSGFGAGYFPYTIDGKSWSYGPGLNYKRESSFWKTLNYYFYSIGE